MDCNICREIIESEGRKLLCGHHYHYECIRDWYKQIPITKTQSRRNDLTPFMCPLCRQYGGPLEPEPGEKPKFMIHLIDRPVPVGRKVCQAIKRNGEKCKNLTKGSDYCGIHHHLSTKNDT